MNLCISGALGKMGRTVLLGSSAYSNINVVCGVDINAAKSDLSFPVYANFTDIKEKIDVIIDFSSANNLTNILSYALENKIALVLATTGYTEAQIAEILSASDKLAIFRSANMSVGINLLIDLVKKAASTIPDFDIEIIEQHHNQKIDAPSGTAIMLADAIKEVDKDKFNIYGREGKVGKRDKREIGIHAIRGGNIVGKHEVIFAGLSEMVTLTHEATDRSIFASGALKASIFLCGKNAGLYNMQDLIREM